MTHTDKLEIRFTLRILSFDHIIISVTMPSIKSGSMRVLDDQSGLKNIYDSFKPDYNDQRGLRGPILKTIIENFFNLYEADLFEIWKQPQQTHGSGV